MRAGGSDIAVYRDQLDEIDRDRAAGLIGAAEAEAAKVEVSRRLIAAADAAQSQGPATDTSPRLAPAHHRHCRVGLAAGRRRALYLTLGSPQTCRASRWRRGCAAQETNPSIERLIAQVEDHVQRNPNDGRAWEVLAPVYMRIGRFDEAVAAWRNAIRLNGSNASREADSARRWSPPAMALSPTTPKPHSTARWRSTRKT